MRSRHEDLALTYVKSVPHGQQDDETAPLVICMHGRGADANDLSDLAPMIDDGLGARYIFPNAPRHFEPYPGTSFGWSWFDGWPPEPGSIASSRALVLQFLDQLLERFLTPPGKVVISGFSQGALMALDIGFRAPQKIAGIVAMSGAINEEDLPDLDAHRDVPVLLVHGVQDDVIPVLAARRTRRVLEEHRIDVEYHEFPMGHFVTPESMAAVAVFVRRVLKK